MRLCVLRDLPRCRSRPARGVATERGGGLAWLPTSAAGSEQAPPAPAGRDVGTARDAGN